MVFWRGGGVWQRAAAVVARVRGGGVWQLAAQLTAYAAGGLISEGAASRAEQMIAADSRANKWWWLLGTRLEFLGCDFEVVII
jgi:hypothetical protein